MEFVMGKEMPELKAGMMIVFDWRHTGEHRYLCLGGKATIDLDNPRGRSQPLVNDNGEVVAVYDVGDHLSIENLVEKDCFYNPKVLWSKENKKEVLAKIKKLEETVKSAQSQLKELKKSY
jgi:hypothetical protein